MFELAIIILNTTYVKNALNKILNLEKLLEGIFLD